jgi:CubicO group peptidase (beta-lactamase class C family)
LSNSTITPASVVDPHYDPARRVGQSRLMIDLHARLAEAADDYGAPGASLAVLSGDEVHTAAVGVLNVETRVEVTPDSLFQIGSTTKVYTATAVMRLAEQGRVDLDRPLVETIPEFRLADLDVAQAVTPRHLLTHTSGIAGDYFADTGRGDDAIARFVECCRELGQDVPLGSTYSYSNTGFVILGHLVERVTGLVWDAAMRELVLEPAGLRHTVTSAEEVTRFRWAYGHVGDPASLAPVWGLPRSAAPAGTTTLASAPDLVRFGRLFLEGGLADDGTRVLTQASIDEMLRPQADVPDRWSSGDHRGLGWMLWDRSGRTTFAHGGATVGQRAFLEVIPDRDLAIGLLVNGGRSAELGDALLRGLQRELAAIEVPAAPEPIDGALDGGHERLRGHYERFGLRTEIDLRDGALVGTDRPVEPLASQIPDPSPITYAIRPSTAGPGVYVARDDGAAAWRPLVAFEVDGQRFLHMGGRAARRVSRPEYEERQ